MKLVNKFDQILLFYILLWRTVVLSCLVEIPEIFKDFFNKTLDPNILIFFACEFKEVFFCDSLMSPKFHSFLF